MPTYEYECKRCRKTFEVFQSITSAPLTKCRFCQGEVKRLVGRGSGFIFKGKGFYATDYRSPEYQRRAREEKEGQEKKCPKPEKR